MRLEDHIGAYWGKARPSAEAGPRWHPLAYHSLEVAAAMEAMLDIRPAWLRAVARGAGLSLDETRKRLLLVAALHDLGKFAENFQWKACPRGADPALVKAKIGRGPPSPPTRGMNPCFLTSSPAGSGDRDRAGRPGARWRDGAACGGSSAFSSKVAYDCGRAISKEACMAAVRGRVVEGGRIIVPAAYRKAMGLAKGDTVLMELRGEELTVRAAKTALRRLQARLRPYAAAGSVVDELIADRRAEAADD